MHESHILSEEGEGKLPPRIVIEVDAETRYWVKVAATLAGGTVKDLLLQLLEPHIRHAQATMKRG